MRVFLFCLLLALATFVQAQEQVEIQLVPGYNLISINITPQDNMFVGNNPGPDVPRMFEQLRDPDGNHLAEIVKNVIGQFYAPRWQFCNIAFWNLEQGLSILVMENADLVWEGERIPPDTDITLNRGWNLVAYYPQFDLNANADDFYVLSPIIDDIVIAKNGQGKFMLPEFNFSNMNPWTQGEGYYVQVPENVVLNYPEELEEDPVAFAGGDHWRLGPVTDVNMSVLVTAIEGPDGFDPGEGDQIGVFTNGGDFVGYGDVFDGNCGIAAWGRDQNNDQIPGLAPGDGFWLLYWDADLEEEFFIDIENIVEGRGLSFSANSITIIEIFVDAEIPGRDQLVPLAQGWNMISINIVPNQEMWDEEEGPDIELMMAEAVEADVLELLKNEDGMFYSPGFNFINVPCWDLTEGYLVNVNADFVCEWSGNPIPFDNEIPIEEGWNYIAYYPECDLEASSPDFYVLSPIIDNVLLAKNGNGDFMTPAFNFSNMPPWTAGQGYQVRVDADVVLQYPEERDEEDAFSAPVEPHRTGIVQTDNNMSLLLNSISGIEPSTGSQITAYSSDGQIAGVGSVRNGRCGLAIWGAESGKSGLQPGEEFELRLWDQRNAIESNLTVSAVLRGNGLIYEVDGFSVLEVAISTAAPDNYYLSGAFPNPFNNHTTVKYGLPEAGLINLAVYDLSGRMMMELANGEQSAGIHELDINCSELTSGIYILSMNANRMSFTQKIVLVK